MALETASCFSVARDHICWACQAIEELRLEEQHYLQSGIWEVINTLDSDTGENVQKVRLVRDPPRQMARRATEALNNVRHAFDQATFAACSVVGKSSKAKLYFPWAQDPGDLDTLLRRRKLDPRLWDAFRSQEPYPTSRDHSGGDDVVRALARLANSKHTVGLSVDGDVSLPFVPGFSGDVSGDLRILIPKWDYVKKEADLLRWTGGVQALVTVHTDFNLILSDTGLPHAVPLVGGLERFASKASSFVETIQAKSFEIVA